MKKVEVNRAGLMEDKWEFVRRNSNYREDYDKYRKAKNKREAEKLIIKKHSVRPLDYKKSYDEIASGFSRMKSKVRLNKRIKREDKKRLQRLAQIFALERAFFPEIENLLVKEDSYSIKNLNYKNLKDMKYKLIPDANKTELKMVKTLRLALNMYYSKGKLLSAIGKIIDTYKTYVKVAHGAMLDRGGLFQVVYEKHCNAFDTKKACKSKDYFDVCTRKGSGLWGSYRKIYDLKIKDKLSFRDIAKKLYPKEFEKEVKKTEPTGKDEANREKLFYKFLKQTGNAELAYKKAYGNVGSKGSNKVIQRVFDRFKEATRMVNSGYKEIRLEPYF